jgi:hypothetical protein
MLGMSEAKKTKKKAREIRNDELFSIAKAADYKGVSTRAVYQRINAGHLPFMRAGDNDKPMKLVYKRDLDAWEVERWRQKQDRHKKEEN